MAFADDRTRPEMAHHIILEEREQLSVSGVEEVESFDDRQVVVQTVKGLLYVRGSALKVNKLEKTTGELTISGQVTGLEYEDTAGRAGFWSRLLK